MKTITDLFGNEIIQDELLRDKFIEPPFSVLDTKQGTWQARKKKWIAKGLRSEIGRDSATYNTAEWIKEKGIVGNNSKIPGTLVTSNGVSIFDPALCEVLYRWFVPDGGTIIDPFAGGSVRGIVANYLGYKYTGIDIRQEQIDSNREQAINILPFDNQPQWYVGDSNQLLDSFHTSQYDFLFSCPPYADLEKYSDLPGDISNMKYKDFLIAYENIIQKSCRLLKPYSFACFVVGEVRDKNGHYIGFVPDTIRAFENSGLKYYNEAILLNAIGSACIRANGNMKSKKLVKVHQNILVFYKP